MANRTVSVALKAQVDQYVTSMRKATAVTKDMQTATKKTTQGAELMGKAATLVGAYAAYSFGKQIIKAASDMNETVQKSNVVFGQNAKAVQAWSEGAAKAMGMSKRSALEAAASYGNLFTSIGLGREVSADMSMRLVQLAADLASFNNTDPTEALDALRSGLVGEVEPLRRFGVNLNDAELRQKALAMGLVTTTKEVLPPAIRTQAAYALVLERTGNAQGDFARTADGLANSQRTANAAWEDAKEALGRDLLPAATGVVSSLTKVLNIVDALPGPARDAALAITAVGAAALLAGPRILTMKAALDAGGISTLAFLGKVGKIAGVVAVAAAAAKGFDLIGDHSINAGMSVETLAAKMIDTGQEVKGLGYEISWFNGTAQDLNGSLEAVAANTAWSQFAKMGNDIVGASSDLGQATAVVDQLNAAFALMIEKGYIKQAKIRYDELRDSYIASGHSGEEFDRVLINTKTALEGQTKAVGPAVQASGDLVDAQGEIIRSSREMATGWYDAEGKLISLTDRMNAMNSPAAALAQAQMDSAEATRALTKSVADNGKAFDTHTVKGSANTKALLDKTKAIQAEAAAMEASNVPHNKVVGWLQKQKAALVETLTQLTGNKKEAQRLADQYLKVPPLVETEFKVRISVTGTGKIVVEPGGKVYYRPVGGGMAFAEGGPIRGAGTKRSDSIPAWLSDGEYIMSADAVDRYGEPFFDALNAQHFATGGPVNYAQRWQAQYDYLRWLSDMGRHTPAQTLSAYRGLLASRGSTLEQRRSLQVEMRRLELDIAQARRDAAAAAAQAQKDKEEAARQAREEAARAAEAAFNARFDTGTFNSMRSAASIMGAFDFGAATQATNALTNAKKEQADAERDLFAARQATNAAGTPQEYAAALAQQAEAQRRVAAATQATADAQKAVAASKPTGANILRGFQDRAQKLAAFAHNLGILAKRGLAPVILKEILDAGIDSGGEMAAALVADANIAALNATMATITGWSSNLAQWSAQWNAATANDAQNSLALGASYGTLGAVGGITGTFNVAVENSSTPIILQMGAEQVWRALLTLKASRGGASLGIG